MQFHGWMTLHQWAQKSLGEKIEAGQFYRDVLPRASPTQQHQLAMELYWQQLRCPYYNVYPGIIPLLTRLRLDVPANLVRPPLRALLLRFPTTEHPLSFQDRDKTLHLRSVLMGETFLDTGETEIELWMDVGEFCRGFPIYTPCGFVRSERTVEDSLEFDHRTGGITVPHEFARTVMKLACTLCLLADDPDIIEPDVLVAHRVKYSRTRDRKHVAQAHRRGKVGWNVGRKLEVIPHYRRPHFALFWTGKDRAIPKIGPRKGSIVKRTLVGEVPTGFMDGVS